MRNVNTDEKGNVDKCVGGEEHSRGNSWPLNFIP